jgi:hypothetical protein
MLERVSGCGLSDGGAGDRTVALCATLAVLTASYVVALLASRRR